MSMIIPNMTFCQTEQINNEIALLLLSAHERALATKFTTFGLGIHASGSVTALMTLVKTDDLLLSYEELLHELCMRA